MRTINRSEDINHHRRRFCGTAAVMIAAARLGLIGAADAQASKTTPAAVPTIKPGTNTSFGARQQTDAGVPVLRAAPRPVLGPDPGWLVRARTSGTWTKVADLAGYEEAANPDHGPRAHLDGGGVFVAGARQSDRCGAQLDGAGPRRCELRGRADGGRGPDHRDDMVTERQLSTDRSLAVKIRGTAVWVLVMWLGVCGATSAAEPSRPLSGAIAAVAEGGVVPRPLLSATLFARTELFFGSLRSDKPPVSEQDFLGFLHDTITPLFPNGLTLLTGLGQFLTSQGVFQQEQSWLLILLYPVEEWRDNHGKIEAIRAEYKKAFAQEAVLRSDRCCEWVGF